MNRRIEWIDVCKALGIIAVVLGHVSVPKSVQIWMSAFYMPMFFILSGLCFDENKHKNIYQFIKTRFKSLIIPYIIFSIFLYFLWIGIESLSYKNLLNCMINPAEMTTCYGAINWFLPALFITEVCFIIIIKFTRKSRIKISIVAAIVSIIGFFIPRIIGFRLPLAIDSSIMGLSFYSFGWIIRTIDFKKIKNYFSNHYVLSCIFVVVLLAMSIKLSWLNGQTNIRTLEYGNYFLYCMNAVGISLLLMIISMLLDLKSGKLINMLNVIGKNTLVILLFNSILARLYSVIIDDKVIIHNKYLLTLNNFIVALVIVTLCVLISKFINKHMPILLGKDFSALENKSLKKNFKKK